MGCELLEIQIPGLRLAAKRWGTPHGPPVLGLHGWLDNVASFDTLAPLLGELDLLVVDLPGHGHSDHLAPDAVYHFIDGVNVVFELAKVLGWDRFSLLGHSMGAGIAALAAGALPQRIERLAMLEGLGPLARSDAEAPERAERYLTERLREPAPPPVYSDLEHAATRLRKVMTDIGPAAALGLVTRGMQSVSGGVTWRSDPRLRLPSPAPFNEERVQAYLARISARSLFIRANRGYPFERAVLETRARSVSGLKVVEVEGGHHVHLEHPTRVAPAVRALFDLQ